MLPDAGRGNLAHFPCLLLPKQEPKVLEISDYDLYYPSSKNYALSNVFSIRRDIQSLLFRSRKNKPSLLYSVWSVDREMSLLKEFRCAKVCKCTPPRKKGGLRRMQHRKGSECLNVR